MKWSYQMPGANESGAGTAGGTGAAASGAAGGAAAGAGGAGGAAGQGGAAAAGAQGQGAPQGQAAQGTQQVEKGWWETPGVKLDLKLPEKLGQLKPGTLDKIHSIAMKHKHGADVANDYLALYGEVKAAETQEAEESFKTVQKEWKENLPKVFGGSVEKFEQGKKDGAAIFEKFDADGKFREFLTQHGLMFNPEFVRFTAAIGAWMREKTSPDSSNVPARQGGANNLPTDPTQRRIRTMYTHPSSVDPNRNGAAPRK